MYCESSGRWCKPSHAGFFGPYRLASEICSMAPRDTTHCTSHMAMMQHLFLRTVPCEVNCTQWFGRISELPCKRTMKWARRSPC